MPTTDLTGFAYRQLERSTKGSTFQVSTLPAANRLGEISGCGPSWSCVRYGLPGHNQIVCRDCQSNFFKQEAA